MACSWLTLGRERNANGVSVAQQELLQQGSQWTLIVESSGVDRHRHRHRTVARTVSRYTSSFSNPEGMGSTRRTGGPASKRPTLWRPAPLPHPVVDHPDITPHHPCVVVGIDLEKEPPIESAWTQVIGTRVPVTAGITAVESVRYELALQPAVDGRAGDESAAHRRDRQGHPRKREPLQGTIRGSLRLRTPMVQTWCSSPTRARSIGLLSRDPVV